MPELPEVETVRRGLEQRFVGRLIERVEVGRERTVRRTSRLAVIDGLTGVTATAAQRRGKYLICPLDSGDSMMIHLRMSGRVLIDPVSSPRPLHTHVVLHLAGPQAEELRFVDPRTFGEVVVYDPDNAAIEMPELSRLGIDPITDGLSRSQLAALLGGRSRQLKALLLDQGVIAGIGNIYADETLHAARLRHDRLSNSLRPVEITRLHQAILDTLKDKKVAMGGIFVVAESARYTHWLSNDELGKIIAAHGGKPQLTAINTATDVVVLGDIGARDIKCVGAPPARARANACAAADAAAAANPRSLRAGGRRARRPRRSRPSRSSRARASARRRCRSCTSAASRAARRLSLIHI